MAATAPKIIDAMERNITIICHLSMRSKKGMYKIFINTVNAATFGKIAKNKVTGVGDPW